MVLAKKHSSLTVYDHNSHHSSEKRVRQRSIRAVSVRDAPDSRTGPRACTGSGRHAGDQVLARTEHEGGSLDKDETIRQGTGWKATGNGGKSDVTVRTKLIYGNISVGHQLSS
jgi:hypothetical protein